MHLCGSNEEKPTTELHITLMVHSLTLGQIWMQTHKYIVETFIIYSTKTDNNTLTSGDLSLLSTSK